MRDDEADSQKNPTHLASQTSNEHILDILMANKGNNNDENRLSKAQDSKQSRVMRQLFATLDEQEAVGDDNYNEEQQD